MTDLELGPLRFGVIGAGRLGLAVARALQARDLEVVHVSSRSQAGRDRAVGLLDVPAHDDPLVVSELVDCVLLCVPDDELEHAVAHLATRAADASPLRLRVVSTSAAGGVAALAPLAALGHTVCVLHPVATVADAHGDAAALRGAGAAIGADDDVARTFAHALAHAMELVPFDLAEPAWPMHAAACSLASGVVGTVLTAAVELAVASDVHDGVARAAYGRLAEAAVARVASGEVVVPGAVVRADEAALGAQVRAVRQHASRYEELLDAGLTAAINAAFVSGRIDMATTRRLSAALGAAMHDRLPGLEGDAD